MSFETESLLAQSAEITTSLFKCKCSQTKTDPETSERLRDMSPFYLAKILDRKKFQCVVHLFTI